MNANRRRGQPIAMLGVVLVGWIGVRATVWEPPFALPGLRAVTPGALAAKPAPLSSAMPEDERAGALAARPASLPDPNDLALPGSATAPAEPALPLARGVPQPMPSKFVAPLVAPTETVAPRVAAAHQLLYLAALGQLPLPPGLALAASPRPTPPPPLLAAAARRWSADAWVLVREGSARSAGGLTAASGFPSYGASQAGGVIRYALAPGSQRAPQAYLRLSRAIGGFDEGEAALGLSARPFAGIPLRLLGEARVQRGGGGGSTRVRPAASLVTELPLRRLSFGVVGEAYAQVGYAGAPIGSKRGATPFFDVQAVADRKLASAGPAELRIGAGAWSGGQNGAARLDLGPRASLRLATGQASSRLALDWRFRVAGNARPSSGPTLTFSAGF